MPDARRVIEWDEHRLKAAAAVGIGELWQLPGGLAGFYEGSQPASSGDQVELRTSGKVTVTKTTGIVLLDGGRGYWDHSANALTFKKVHDRDFYAGRIVGDATSTDTTCVIDLNADPPYDLDIARDPFVTAIIGTQALGGLALNRRGGGHNLVISSTNEAQKLDLLSKDGFDKAANAIVEFAFSVPNDGAAANVDVSVGIANATHATDADSITDSLFMHLNSNDVNIYFESDDGTNEVAATDSTIDYTEGQLNRVEVWFDLRDPADIQIYVNGVNVLPATVFRIDASVAVWKLLAHIEKTAATDVYEFDLDWLRARLAEQ